MPDERAARDAAALKTRLAGLLPAGRMTSYEALWDPQRSEISRESLAAFCNRVQTDLEQAIELDLDSVERRSPLDEEIDRHSDFRDERSRVFIGRRDLIEKIVKDANRKAKLPLVLFGVSGAGKSAVMARVSSELSARASGSVVVNRFIGASPGSSALQPLLRSLCGEIASRYEISEPVPVSTEDLVHALPRFCAHATRERPLIVLVDALDQLSDADRAFDLSWLPSALPPYTSFVVSILERDGAAGRALRSARTRLPERRFERIAPLQVSEGASILDAWLLEAGRTLTGSQRNDVLSKFEGCPLPLYLKVAFEEVRLWRSFDGLPVGADNIPGLNDSVAGVVLDMLARLEAADQHGRVLVERSMSYLAVARNGLSDDEMLRVLSADTQDVMRDQRERSPESPRTDALPELVWSRLYFDLAPYLTQFAADQSTLLTFYHRVVREVVEDRYLKGAAVPRAQHLAQCFAEEQTWLGRGSFDRRPNYRKASELIHLWLAASEPDRAALLLGDFDFVQSKTQAGMVFDLVAEYGRLRPERPAAAIGQVEEYEAFVRAQAHVLATRPELLPEIAYDWTRSRAVFEAASAVLGSQGWQQHRWLRRVVRRELAGQASLQTFAGHTGSVTCLALAPAGGWIVSGSEDKTIKVWDAAAGVCVSTLSGHDGIVTAMSVSSDGKLLATGSTDGRVGVWDLETMRLVKRLSGHGRSVSAVVIGPDGREVVTASSGRYTKSVRARIITWRLDSLRRDHDFEIGMSGVKALAIAGDGQTILAGDEDGIEAWSLATESRSWSLPKDSESRCLVVRPRRQTFLTGSIGILCRRLSDGQRLTRQLSGSLGQPTSLAVDASGNTLVAGQYGNTVEVWDLRSQKLRTTYRGHSRPVRAVAITADGTRAVSGGDDFTVRLWDLGVSGEGAETPAYEREPVQIAEIPGVGRVVTAGEVGTPKMWRLHDHSLERRLEGLIPSFHSFAVTPDGSQLVTASFGGIRFYRFDTGKKVHEIPIEASYVNSIAVSRDGQRVFFSAMGGLVECWDVPRAGRLWQRKGHGYMTSSVCLTPDGSGVLTSGWSGGVLLRDPGTGRVKKTLRGASLNIYAIAVSPDGRVVVAGAPTGHVEAFALSDGRRIWSQAHENQVWSVSITLDGGYALSAGTDRMLILWDLETGAEVARYVAGAELRHCLALSTGEIAISDVHGDVDFLELMGSPQTTTGGIASTD
jgi:WD40 repeat protein